MPKVPTYSGQQVKDSANPAASVTTSMPEGFTGGGKAAQGVNNEIAKILQEEKKKADDISYAEALAKLTEAETKILYDKDYGALNQKGKNSFDIYDPSMESHQGQVDAIKKGLNSDVAARFNIAAMRSRNGVDRSLNKHMSGERQKYDVTVTQKLIENERNAAIENFHDPERVTQSIATIQSGIEKLGERQGWDREVIDAELENQTSGAHVGILNRMLANKITDGARAYYDKNKGNITGTDAIKIEKMLQGEENLVFAQNTVEAWMDKDLSYSQALEKSKKLSGEKQKEVRAMVKQMYGDKQGAIKLEQQDRFQSLWNDVVEKDSTIKNFNELPVSADGKTGRNSLTPSQQNTLRNYFEKKKSGTIKTDMNTFYMLDQMVVTPEGREQFADLHLLEYVDRLSSSDFKDFSELQKKYKTGGVTPDLELTFTNKDILKQRTQDMGDAEKERLYKWVKAYEASEAEEKGRKLNSQEYEDLLDRLTMKVTFPNYYMNTFNSDRPFFHAKPGDQIKIPFESIPTRDVRRIEKLLKKQGDKKITQEDITVYFRKEMNRKAK